MAHLQANFDVPSCDGLLVTAIKPVTRENVRVAYILFYILRKYNFNKLA
jgi:hypothetical protein